MLETDHPLNLEVQSMSNWECSICGYVHKEGAPPEKCPVCDAPAKMFEEAAGEEQKSIQPQPAAVAVKRWRCTVCGYVHTGDEPPEICPVCDAPKKMFVEIDEEGNELKKVEADTDDSVAVHQVEKEKKPSSFFDKFAAFSLKNHLHPISVHFPNGILPVIVVFLGISAYFNIVSLEVAAYYNLIFLLLALPLVLLTGFIEWQKRYKGIKTAIFITKIICSLIVLVLVAVLVFWRLIDPEVMAAESPSRLIYVGIAAIVLGVAGFAGYLGGKLFYGSRG
jgi:rubredoxin/uncharacterized membrane protein